MNTATDYEKCIEISAPTADVFAAIGTLEGLRGWWTPLASGSPATNGDATFEFAGVGERVVMHVDEATPNRAVRWTCTEHTGHQEWVGTHPTFVIRPIESDRSQLDFHHVGLAPVLDCYDACAGGWDHFLASIAAYAETGSGSPFGAPRATRTIVDAYHRAWTTKRFDEAIALLAPAVDVQGPINGYPDRDAFAVALRTFGERVASVDVLSELVADDEAMLLYDMNVDGLGVMRVVEHFTVADNEIIQLRQIHDTAPIRGLIP